MATTKKQPKKDKKDFHSVTQVEKEFLPIQSSEKKKRERIEEIEKKFGKEMMADILSLRFS